MITRAGRLIALDGTSLSAWTLGSGPGHPRLRSHATVAYPHGTAVAAAPDGSVVTGTDAGDVTRWSVSSTPARLGNLSGGGSGKVTALATDGRRVVAATEQGDAVIWDLSGRTLPVRHDVPITAEPIRAAVATDGRLAVGTDEGAIVYGGAEAATGRRGSGEVIRRVPRASEYIGPTCTW